MKRMRLPLSLGTEDLLVACLLFTTVNHIASFLSRFEAPGLKFVAYFTAGGIELAIARSAFLYKVHKGQKQRAWALTTLLFFCGLSVVCQFYYFRLQQADIIASAALALMAPGGIFLVSYLRGIRSAAEQVRAERQARKKSTEQVKQTEASRPPLSDEQEHIIRLYRDDPGTSLATLASSLGVSKTTASRKVQTLINLEYLKRDGREVRIVERGDGSHG